jgi:recombination protein RecT
MVDNVLARINQFQELGQIDLPKDYSVGNALKAAMLVLTDLKDRNGKPVMEACTKPSIANALLKMATEGMSVAKRQGAFIAYGDQLTWQREYQGDVLLAKRYAGVQSVRAQLIYKGDKFVTKITQDGRTVLVEHESDFSNHSNDNIIGAYAVVVEQGGETNLTAMSMDEIKVSWSFGQTKGGSMAHTKTPGEMAKKTVIRRACKPYINSSDDEAVVDGERDIPKQTSDQTIRENANKTEVGFEDVPHEEVRIELPQSPEPAVESNGQMSAPFA